MIDMNKITDYVSIEKQMLLDAQKYLNRANDYLKENKYGHCAGCLAKAARKITKAQHFGLLIYDDGIDKILKIMTKDLSKNIADSLLNKI